MKDIRKYKWFTYEYEPLYPGILGSKHTREFKAIDEAHALKQAKKEEKFCVAGMQVYRLTKLVRVSQ